MKPGTKRCRGARPAFTLLETLAVVVLLALAAATVGARLTGSNTLARVRATAAAAQEADARARLLAVSHGRVAIQVEPGSGDLIAVVDGERSATLRAPAGMARFDLFHGTTGQPLSLVWIDSRGRSEDYSASCSLEGRVARWSVAGLSGWTTSQGVTTAGGPTP
jgi:type II secretory pathway pseudopilin PulG